MTETDCDRSNKSSVQMMGLLALAVAVGVGGAARAKGSDSRELLAAAFQDHAVLQASRETRIWGKAAPGEPIIVRVGAARAMTRADRAGDWVVRMSLQPARSLVLSAEGTVSGKAVRRDVAIGDVLLCSGQSNMEWPLSRTPDRARPDAKGTTNIRLLKIPRRAATAPATDMGNARWQLASDAAIQDFSALCWLTARTLQKRRNRPIGLIDASWGGTRIEPWISSSALASQADAPAGLKDRAELLARYGPNPAAATEAFFAQWQDWWIARGGVRFWQNGSALEWLPVPLPWRDWKTWDDPALAAHNGVVVFRREVALSREQAAAMNRIELGAIDELDMVWVNGRPVGHKFGWAEPRAYPLAAGVLREGVNEIIVAVSSDWDKGGMFGPAEAIRLVGEGAPVALGASWQRARQLQTMSTMPRAPWDPIGGVSVIQHGMLAPLGPYSLAGIAWYQGESNAGEPDSYRALLETLIDAFRHQFGMATPVSVVQLPEFGAAEPAGADSGWASLRQAQHLAVASRSGTAFVVTMGTGTPDDIHPPDKRPVAVRLARSLEVLWSGNESARLGVRPASVRQGSSPSHQIIRFTGGALANRAGDAVVGFAVCGLAPSPCVLASASVSGASEVTVVAPDGFSPMRIRYCWGSSPTCGLRDGAGMPVAPFEWSVSGRP